MSWNWDFKEKICFFGSFSGLSWILKIFILTFEKARISRTIVCMVWCLGIRKCHYAFLKFSIKWSISKISFWKDVADGRSFSEPLLGWSRKWGISHRQWAPRRLWVSCVLVPTVSLLPNLSWHIVGTQSMEWMDSSLFFLFKFRANR